MRIRGVDDRQQEGQKSSKIKGIIHEYKAKCFTESETLKKQDKTQKRRLGVVEG